MTDNNILALRVHLQAFVPLQIALLERNGGITDEHINWAKQQVETIAWETDILFNGCAAPGQAAKIAGILTQVLAIMSFTPGGRKRIELWIAGMTDEEVVDWGWLKLRQEGDRVHE